MINTTTVICPPKFLMYTLCYSSRSGIMTSQIIACFGTSGIFTNELRTQNSEIYST